MALHTNTRLVLNACQVRISSSLFCRESKKTKSFIAITPLVHVTKLTKLVFVPNKVVQFDVFAREARAWYCEAALGTRF
jgi:hypothetical protein